MSAVIESNRASHPARVLPLLAHADPRRILVWRKDTPIRIDAFLADVHALAARLPTASFAVNLCADRYRFLVAFCAVAIAGQTNLLPASRAPQAITETMRDYPDSYALSDVSIDPAPPRLFRLPNLDANLDNAVVPDIAADRIVAIGFTSGSTGRPSANPKTWGSFCTSSALNAAQVCPGPTTSNIVATVPPQHMYGLETSVLLPLRGNAAVYAGQPFFPADVAHALADVPEPRILVTTPVHLRALLREMPALPVLDAIVSATAPLDTQTAALAEMRYATRVIELFGSTETCVIAHRRTASETNWQLYAGVDLQPQPDGTLVEAPHFAAPVCLQDIVELLPSRQFTLRGRNADLLEIAGKRASVGELTRRLLAIPGVEDAVVFQLDADPNGIRRLAALVVAQNLSETQIRDALRQSIDPVFLPRPLRRVTALPRNATGKLPRDALLAAIRE